MIIVITGPTGVGKTKLSIELAKKYNCEIINGDAIQVYRGLDIGSAKVTREEMDGVVHHLFDIKDVWEEYSIFDYYSYGIYDGYWLHRSDSRSATAIYGRWIPALCCYVRSRRCKCG